MLVACWSVKGGSGTTVVAACLSLLLARSSPAGALLVDLGGDAPDALGVPDATGPGVFDWVAAEGDAAALHRLAVEADECLRVVPWRGATPGDAASVPTSRDGERLVDALTGCGPCVVDCGPPGSPMGLAVAAAATLSLLVVRPCYLAYRRAMHAPLRPSRLVVIEERSRVLRASDLAMALDVPIGAQIPWDANIARSVDGGLLHHGLPRSLERALAEAA